jgi:hypothetical protein
MNSFHFQFQHKSSLLSYTSKHLHKHLMEFSQLHFNKHELKFFGVPENYKLQRQQPFKILVWYRNQYEVYKQHNEWFNIKHKYII